jgi:hypothetical protein
MKRIAMMISAATVLLSMALPTLAQESNEEKVVVSVPFGTIVMATLEEGLSTVAKARKAEAKGYRQVKAGDTVIARVTEDVTVEGRTAIAAGAPVTLRVGSETKKNRRMGRKGLLVLDAVMVQAVDGKAIPLDGKIDSEGRGRIGTTVALTYALGPLGLLKKGKAAELSAGGVYQVMVMGQTEVTVAVPSG